MAGKLFLVGLLLKVCHGLPVPLPQYYPATMYALPPQLLQPMVALTQLVSQLISYKLHLVAQQLYGTAPATAPAGNSTGQCPSQLYPFVSTLITSLAGHSNTIPQVNIPGAPANQHPPVPATYYESGPQEYVNYPGPSEYANAQPVGDPNPIVISSQPPSDPQSGLPPQAAPPPQVVPPPPLSGTPPGSQSAADQNPYDFQNQPTGNAPGGVNPMSGDVPPGSPGNIPVQSPSQGPNPAATPEGTPQFGPLPGSQSLPSNTAAGSQPLGSVNPMAGFAPPSSVANIPIQPPFQGPNPVATPEGTPQFGPLPGSQLPPSNTAAGSQSPGSVNPMAGSAPPVSATPVQPPPEGASQPNPVPVSGSINPIPPPQLPVSPNIQFQPISAPSPPISNPPPNINFSPSPVNSGLDAY